MGIIRVQSNILASWHGIRSLYFSDAYWL